MVEIVCNCNCEIGCRCFCTLLQVLSSEREKHAATETELNMKNLGLADKLKEARGELTGTL